MAQLEAKKSMSAIITPRSAEFIFCPMLQFSNELISIPHQDKRRPEVGMGSRDRKRAWSREHGARCVTQLPDAPDSPAGQQVTASLASYKLQLCLSERFG